MNKFSLKYGNASPRKGPFELGSLFFFYAHLPVGASLLRMGAPAISRWRHQEAERAGYFETTPREVLSREKGSRRSFQSHRMMNLPSRLPRSIYKSMGTSTIEGTDDPHRHEPPFYLLKPDNGNDEIFI